MKMTAHALGPALALLLWQSAAHAALGSDARSVSIDREAMQAELHSTPMQQYVLHEITTGGGTLVHEYETTQGQIFAVTWSGPMPPNLTQLFGTYYEQYRTASAAEAASHPGMHRQISISQPDFVMQALGRMRSFHGKAFIPSLVPSGVSVADLP